MVTTRLKAGVCSALACVALALPGMALAASKASTVDTTGKEAAEVAAPAEAAVDKKADSKDAEKNTGGVETVETVPLPVWETELDCAPCHAAEVESADNSECLYGLHASLVPECTVCHNQGEILQGVHDNAKEGKKAKRLKKSSVEDGVCLTCHRTEDLVEAVADLDLLTDANGLTVNPHGLPAVEGHAKIACVSCHTMHKAEDVAEEATSLCFGCHHASVFECGTCHEV